jgi:fucose permease
LDFSQDLFSQLYVRNSTIDIDSFLITNRTTQGVSVGSKLFPEDIRSTALSFVFVFAQMGGSVFPIVTGVVAARAGVAILQPVLVSLLVAAAVSWVIVPKPKTVSNVELHQE